MFEHEDRIEKMLADGKKIIDEAIYYVENELKKEIHGIIAAFSGGNDSIVATHFANSNVEDCITFNADTMTGLKPTRDHIARTIQKYGWTAEIIKATSEGPPKENPSNQEFVRNWRDGESAYEEFVLNWGFAGPPMHARMYQRLKERPLMALRRKIKQGARGGRLIVISGIRHDESSIRAGYKRAWHDVPAQGLTWVNPFYNFTAADFELYRQEFGLARNPVKALCGISGECCCGAFGSKCERESYRIADPAFSNYLDALEKKVRERFPWGWGECPPKWWLDQRRGQKFFWDMQDIAEQTFQPMCVGCNNGRR